MPPEAPRMVFALILAGAISLRALRRHSLSRTGAAAAFVVGLLSYASGVRFGLTLYAFYLAGTRATRYKAEYKKRVEDGHTSSTGNRGAMQVLASSLPAVIFAVAHYILFRTDAAVDGARPLQAALQLAFLLFFAACAGDTFASEIGIAMPGPGRLPRLILPPWRRVPRGTNGGVTWEGTAASVMGGFLIGLAFFLAGPELSAMQAWLVVVGVIGGVVGSALDSVIGAIAQASWLEVASDRVLRETGHADLYDGKLQHICGVDLLSGEAVNAVAAILTSATAPLFFPLFR